MILCINFGIVVTMYSAHSTHVGGEVQYHGGTLSRGNTSRDVAQISTQKFMTDSVCWRNRFNVNYPDYIASAVI